jgi:sterol desaturase/sphingolipid hydroxylase (fatty acid hydroxylase superfamily)
MEYQANRINRAALAYTLVIGAIVSIGFFYFLARGWQGTGRLQWFLDSIRSSDSTSVYLNPYFWAMIAGILVLELLVPVKTEQKIFSVGFSQDVVYFISMTLFQLFLLPIYGSLFKYIYRNYFSFLTIESASTWPLYVRALTAILLSDFLVWFHHLIRHKVQLFWYFHSIHHSQRELNLFTDLRYHPVEYLISKAIIFIPIGMLKGTFPIVLGYVFFYQWYAKFEHGNVRTNMGILKYILVTPQSHRIHHSIEDRHCDKNFGGILSIWDYLFGTQYRNYDEYPECGVADSNFPVESRIRRFSLISQPLAQFFYPFRLIIRRTLEFFGVATKSRRFPESSLNRGDFSPGQ